MGLWEGKNTSAILLGKYSELPRGPQALASMVTKAKQGGLSGTKKEEPEH